MIQSESGPKAAERRTQARIDLRIPVEVNLPGADKPVRAITRDLSWGGALLQFSHPLPAGVDSMALTLPWRKGKSIRALGQPLREQPLEDGGSLVALRFVSLSPRSQNRLERLLHMLYSKQAAPGTGKPALFRELEVTVGDAEELREILTQILEGQYQVTVFDAYQVNQSIRLSITGTLDLPTIRLRARVTDVKKSEFKDCDWAELYTLSLQFEHPGKTIQTFVDLALKQLSNTESEMSTYSYLDGAPDWLRSVATTAMAHSPDSESTGRPGAESDRSCLEREFPESIDRLIAGWGDPEGFELMFDKLVLSRNDDAKLSNGWSPEAWDELEMLQNVHDLAYGLSEHRKAKLKGGRL